MSEKHKDVEKMIAKVMKKRDLSRNDAMDYMLGVATGRLNALWRYDETLPEGKQTKGILQLAGRKKRAEKSPRISILSDLTAEPKAEKRPKNKAKAVKPPAKKAAKKRKAVQVEIAEVVASTEE
jgi:hypothetical protein